ncbi:MAG: hypothetical protein H0U85_03870 [Gemmatimonadales bacterium]|nr:hypothetical protein [Gemmatimonadales bacterium]
MRRWWTVVPLAVLTACHTDTTGVGGTVSPPTHLTYELEPTGTPAAPSGLVLRWDFDTDPDLAVWNIYSRGSTSDAYQLRGTTTSNSFHDSGQPHLEYYVTAEDRSGGESAPSAVVTIDERLALPAPLTLQTTTLDGAIALTWSDNAYTTSPDAFRAYHVYSTSYDLDLNQCGTTWSREGTTVSAEFVVSSLTNGVPRCFGVSAVSVEGYESVWGPLRSDTPRPDAYNVIVYARQASATGSAFRFWQDANADGRVQDAELGIVKSGAATDADFAVDRDGTGGLLLTPVRTAAQVVRYGTGTTPDLPSIGVAPVSGYSRTALQALPGTAYVFRMAEADGFFRYGAVRVTHAGQDFLILDWSYQPDRGNPDLVVGAH